MAEPNTIYKIAILSMLDNVDFPLSNAQISAFFLDKDYTDFFTVQQILTDLILSEMIVSEEAHSTTYYSITQTGSETLNFLKDKLTPGMIDDISAYFEKNKIQFRNDNSVFANYDKAADLGYNVRCQLKEKDITAMDITLHVMTKAQAETICENWKKQYMDVYSCLMDMLVV